MKIFKKYLSVLLTTLVLLLFGIYLVRNPQIIEEIVSISPIYTILIMLVYLLIFYIEGIFILVTLKVFSKNISTGESFYISILSRIGNYLLPMRAGAIFRATYLKKKYNFDYSNFLSTLYGYYIIFFLTNSFLALIVLFLKWRIHSQFFLPLTIFFALVLFGMLFLVFLRIPFKKIFKNSKGILDKIFVFLDKFLSGWGLIVKNKKLFLELILLAFGNILLNIFVVYFEFIAIGNVGNILDITLYTCLSGLSLLVSITPGSLGIREGVFLLTSTSLGLTEQEVMKIAILDRGIMFLLLLISLLAISLFVKKFNLKKLYFEKNK